MKRAVITVLVFVCVSLFAQEEFPRVNAVVRAVRKSGKAVVNISTQRIEKRVDPFFEFRRRFFQDPFENYFSRERTQTYTVQSIGSGVVIDSSGYIITNEHVIHHASKIMVSISGEEKPFEGKLVSAIPEKDLALIKIESSSPLAAIEMGDSDTLMIGETVIALGNPFGLENTVTTGVVSATNRSVYSEGNAVFSGVIQTDAAINPGNSGGALLDINGRLIGINTAIKQKAEGIGFAIPVNEVKNALKNLLSIENAKGLWLGVTVSEAKDGTITVSGIDRDSPAEKAGLKKGDVITRISGREVTSCLGFYKEVMNAADDGKMISFEINNTVREITLEKYGESLIALRCGLKGVNLTRWIARRLRITAVENGVLVSAVYTDSPAELIGIEAGDVIVKFGNSKVAGVNDLISILRDVGKEDKIPIVIVRGSKVLKGELTAR